MAVLEICYDLIQPGRNYAPLYEAIKSYGGWAHVTESVWCVYTEKSCKEVCDHLAQFIDGNDRLFVAKLTREAAWRGLPAEVSKWLQDNL